jgi:hypothetical protein
MAADAFHHDLEGVDIRQRIAFHYAHGAVRHIGGAMQRDRLVRLRELGKKPRAQHQPRPQHPLLRMLADHDHGALPFVAQLRQRPRRADKARHVNVVTAGVHDVDLPAQVVLHHFGARIRRPRLLLHRQAVQIRAHHDDRPVAIFEHAHNAIAAHLFRDLESGRPQFLGHPRRRFELMQREFRIRMQFLVERHQRRQLSFDNRLRTRGEHGRHGQAGQKKRLHAAI